MPVSKSAIKAMKQTLKASVKNKAIKANFRGKIKAVKKAVTTNEKNLGAMTSAAYQAIDKAAKSGVIHKNTAARRKSRLMASLEKTLVLTSIKEAPKTPAQKKKRLTKSETTKPNPQKPKTKSKTTTEKTVKK